MPLPTPPSRRLAWDKSNATLWEKADSQVATQITGGTRTNINNEATSGFDLTAFGWGGNEDGYITLIFDEPKDVFGAFFGRDPGALDDNFQMQVSTDATNGSDGTWTTVVTDVPVLNVANYRTAIETFTALGITGIRQRLRNGASGEIQAFHVYGIPGSAASADRLAFDDPIAEYTVVKDYGDQGAGGLTKTQMAVRNKSATLTAQQVVLAVEALTGPSAGYYEFSIDDSVYTTSLNVGDLVPGGSQTFWVKQDLPPAAGGAEVARIYTDVSGGWI